MEESKFLSSLFVDRLTNLEKKIFQKRLVEYTLFGVACSLTVTTLLAVKQPKQLTISYLLGSGVLSLSALGWSKKNEPLENRYDTFLNLNKEGDKLEVKHQYLNGQALTTMVYENELSEVVNGLTPGAQQRYTNMFDLQGLVIPPNFKSEKTKTIETPGIITIQNPDDLEQTIEYDTAWIDDQFIQASKIVVGAKNSGKSTYLRYEAARWLKNNPEGTLLIFDPHYDVNDPTKAWLKDLNQEEVYQVYVFKEIEDIRKYFLNAYAELAKRIKHGLKGAKPYKCIFDEEEHLFSNFDDSTFECFQKFVNITQNEGRKYLFDVTIGMHSLKQKNTGLDSETLVQMEWVLFEKACYSNTTKYPADFDSKLIRNEALKLKSILTKEKCKVVVIIKQEESEPLVTLLPYLTPPKLFTNSQEAQEYMNEQTEEDKDIEEEIENKEDYEEEPNQPIQTEDIPNLYIKVRNWYREYTEKIGSSPTINEIKLAWETATGKELGENALLYLVEKLQSDTLKK